MILRNAAAKCGPLGSVALSLLLASPAKPQPTQSPSDLERVSIGSTAPDFELPSASGAPVKLSDFRGKNVVLVFYRGYW
jgi:cytochrome oxidase Cu insertion factor (SCO1/SenC/PrrC family)